MVFSISDIEFNKLITAIIQDGRRHECYTESCDHADEMSVHLYGKLPSKLLNIVRPREDVETKRYRLDAYQPTTKSTAEKAVSILSKIFNPSIYSIRWKDQSKAGQQLENYTIKEYPQFNSIVNFVSESLLKKMLADPNAFIVSRPINLTIPSTTRAQAIVKVFGSANTWYFDKDMWLFFIRKEFNSDIKGEVYYFEYYDNVQIIEFSAYIVPSPYADQRSMATLDVSASYKHGCDEAPLWQTRGTPELLDNGAIIYKSFFDGALPHWNLAVTHESDLFGAYINHLHPLRTELAEECDYRFEGQPCIRGKIQKSEGGEITCPSCFGSGYRSVRSPYGVYQYNKEKLQEGTTSFVPVSYITIPVEPTKMLEDRVDKMHEKGLNAINMDIVNKVGENQSGKAKVIDRGELYDFLSRIATAIFDVHLNNIYYFFNLLMFKPSIQAKPNDPTTPDALDKNLPEINKPVQFDITSALELMNEIDAGKKAGMNPAYTRQRMKEVTAKTFATNTDMKLKMDLILKLDPISDYTVDEIIALQSGAQKMWPDSWVIVHFNIERFISQLLEKDEKKFISLDYESQMALLFELADKEVVQETKVKLNPSMNSDSQQDSGQITDPNNDTAATGQQTGNSNYTG